MKILFLIIIFSFVAFPYHAYSFPANVIRVIDGDTIVVSSNQTLVTVRLWGIDAPEAKQPMSLASQRYLKSITWHRTVEVKVMDIDKYKRLVAMIYDDNVNINREMVKAGLVWVYDRYCDQPICDEWHRLQKQAKQAKLGLWQLNDPTPPWEYRIRGDKEKAPANNLVAFIIIIALAFILWFIINLIQTRKWAKKLRKWNR